jgi:hypothetical protein
MTKDATDANSKSTIPGGGAAIAPATSVQTVVFR